MSRPRSKAPAVRVLLGALAAAAIAVSFLILLWPAPFASTSETVTTTRSGATTKTVTQKKTTSPSNTFVGGVLGIGVLLLLAAALFDRLQELKGPGGIGVVLRKEDTDQVAMLAVDDWTRRQGREPTPEEAALVAANAVTAAHARLLRNDAQTAAAAARLDEGELRLAAAEAVEFEMRQP